MTEVLVIKNITKKFRLSKKQMKMERSNSNIKVAVNDLSFSIYQGEIFGLLGPNGAGKTTTLRAIATLIKPDSGDILVNGNSVMKEPQKVRKDIGFLTSELKLEDFFTPNYLFDFFSNLHGITPEKIKERKEYLFSKFGIDKFAEVKVAELSTGMKQKVSLAVSLVHNPNIIVFDEPTNGLDIITAKVVTDFLIELKNSGKTIIISTHIFELIEKICDRVAIIIDGELQLINTLAEVTKQEKLEQVFYDLYFAKKGDN